MDKAIAGDCRFQSCRGHFAGCHCRPARGPESTVSVLPPRPGTVVLARSSDSRRHAKRAARPQRPACTCSHDGYSEGRSGCTAWRPMALACMWAMAPRTRSVKPHAVQAKSACAHIAVIFANSATGARTQVARMRAACSMELDVADLRIRFSADL